MTSIPEMIKMSGANLDVLDLTPFSEPVEVEVDKLAKGYMVKCRIAINKRWGVGTKYLEANRIFGHKGDLSEEDIKKEFATAIADIQEKRLFVFKANHGLLDTANGKVRFKA